ncbi:GAF domain-containing protein [Streptomyces sp. NPDC001275]
MTPPAHPPFTAGHPAPALPTRPDRPEYVMAPPDVHRHTVSGEDAQELAEQAARDQLIHELGIPTGASDLYDQFANRMALETGFKYGMVNLFLGEQTFIGLHNPPPESGFVIVQRTMSRANGWCPEVVKRRMALPLFNVHAAPRFSGNAVVDAVGVQSYFGAPLLHPESGICVGTVCVIDPEPRHVSEARRLRDIVVDTGREVMGTFIDQAARH